MELDSQSVRPPSAMVGTRPVGLRWRYSSWSVPPNLPPASWRWYGTSSSSQHHSTFCTLNEFFLPQISSISYSFPALLTGTPRRARFSNVDGENETREPPAFREPSARNVL